MCKSYLLKQIDVLDVDEKAGAGNTKTGERCKYNCHNEAMTPNTKCLPPFNRQLQLDNKNTNYVNLSCIIKLNKGKVGEL